MRRLLILCLFVLLIIVGIKVWADQMTITTYYPAPYGVYRNFTTTNDTSLATAGGGVGIGGAPRPADSLAVYGRVSTNFPGGGTQQIFAFDLAEDIPATADVEAGDVVVIDASTNTQVTKSTKPYDTLVAGVISTNPAFHISMPDGKTPLALAGRVLCKVTTEEGGPVKRGDLLVTSSKPGYAMRARAENLPSGTVLGKALEPLDSGDGKIMILVTLQ
ncbi:MAG: hypothetical protein V1727_01815 [Candidatus Omnitrophota bacterium]